MGRGVGDHRARLLKPAFAKWKRGCGGAVRRPILPPRSAWLSRPAARADRPDRDQRVAVDDMNMVVEIDRRVAVRDGQRHRVAGGQRAADIGRDQRRMFVAHEDKMGRSEEHTSELQSLMHISYAVFCLKKTKQIM